MESSTVGGDAEPCRSCSRAVRRRWERWEAWRGGGVSWGGGGEGVDRGFRMGDGDCEERGGNGMVLRGSGDLRFRIAEFILGLVIMG